MEERKTRDLKGLARVGSLVVLAGLAVAFVVDNSERVRVGFVFFDAHVRLIWVLTGTFVIGGVLDRLVRTLRARSSRP